MSVESQIPHLETDRDLVLGLCDDFFFLKELAASDGESLQRLLSFCHR